VQVVPLVPLVPLATAVTVVKGERHLLVLLLFLEDYAETRQLQAVRKETVEQVGNINRFTQLPQMLKTGQVLEVLVFKAEFHILAVVAVVAVLIKVEVLDLLVETLLLLSLQPRRIATQLQLATLVVVLAVLLTEEMEPTEPP